MKKLFLGAAAAALTSFGAANAVVLELSLGVDVSGSVDGGEFALQRDGYISAFQSTAVKDAIEASVGGIAVNYFYWSGSTQQAEVVGWTLLQTAADSDAFAAAIAAAPRTFSGSTGLGAAMQFAINSINSNAFDGTRKVIDISGDGPNNTGVNPLTSRNNAQAQGITINGLAIGGTSLTDYYRDNVRTADGFVLSATFDSFEQAVTRKIAAEIKDDNPIPVPGAVVLMGSALAGFFGLKRKKA